MLRQVVLVGLASATAVTIALVPAVAGGGAARRIRPCHAAQVRFVAQAQPLNSAITGFSITGTTTVPGLSCTVRGYPSVTLPTGNHGSVTVKMEPHLLGGGGPEQVFTLSRSKAKSGGFYVFNTRSCDVRSGAISGRVQFGLANGERARGSARMNFCKTSETVLSVSPFLG